jgi:hypothetical protein
VGGWEWRCREGHVVAQDAEGPLPIRAFCAALYETCLMCDPEETDDE